MNKSQRESYEKHTLPNDMILLVRSAIGNKKPFHMNLPVPGKPLVAKHWLNETTARRNAMYRMADYLGYVIVWHMQPPAQIRRHGVASAILHEFRSAPEIAAWLLHQYKIELDNRI